VIGFHYVNDYRAAVRTQNTQRDFEAPHRIGNHTLLHRTALKNFRKDEKPTADELFRSFGRMFALTLGLKHLTLNSFTFAISETEHVVVMELSRKPMTIRSACEAVRADADVVLREIPKSTRKRRNFYTEWKSGVRRLRSRARKLNRSIDDRWRARS
jgi:hypothetical protein